MSQTDSINDIFDLTASAEDQQTAQPYANFGQLTIGARFFKWQGKGNPPVDIDLAEYRTLPERSRGMEQVFSINTQEFNPALESSYKRNVRPSTLPGSDWRASFIPSVVKVVLDVLRNPASPLFATLPASLKELVKPQMKDVDGKKVPTTLEERAEMSVDHAHLADTLRWLNGKYVQTAEVDQQPTKNNGHINKDTGKPYQTITIAKVYPDRAACYAEWFDRFGASAAAQSGPSAAETLGYNEEVKAMGWSVADWATLLPAITEYLKTGRTVDDVVNAFGAPASAVNAVLASLNG